MGDLAKAAIADRQYKERAIQRALKRRGQRESALEEKCVAYAKARGWRARKMNGLGFRDWPDRLFIPRVNRRGKLRSFWVEFKRLGQLPTEAQGRMADDLAQRGEIVYTCDNFERFIDIFKQRNG